MSQDLFFIFISIFYISILGDRKKEFNFISLLIKKIVDVLNRRLIFRGVNAF